MQCPKRLRRGFLLPQAGVVNYSLETDYIKEFVAISGGLPVTFTTARDHDVVSHRRAPAPTANCFVAVLAVMRQVRNAIYL
jgi:hypothetical protein